MGKIKHRVTRDKIHKTPATNPAELPRTIDYPILCLHYLSQKYCITKCNRDEKAGFADAIRMLSQQKWSQIITNRVLDFEKIRDRRDIREAVPQGLTEDLPIIGFLFHDRKRMVGCRSGPIFHIIWLDRDFSLYNHGR